MCYHEVRSICTYRPPGRNVVTPVQVNTLGKYYISWLTNLELQNNLY